MIMPLRNSMKGVVLAVSMVLLGTTPAPPRLDAEMAERVVSGAEWLSKQAGARKILPPETSMTQDRIEWLLSGGLGAKGNDRQFSKYLATLGYQQELAIYQFLEELPLVLRAYEASKNKGIRERLAIRKEMNALPTLPLNEKDEQRLAALIHERDLASVSEEAKQIISAYAERIQRLFPAPRKGVKP